jgi:hypothetical protein
MAKLRYLHITLQADHLTRGKGVRLCSDLSRVVINSAAKSAAEFINPIFVKIPEIGRVFNAKILKPGDESRVGDAETLFLAVPESSELGVVARVGGVVPVRRVGHHGSCWNVEIKTKWMCSVSIHFVYEKE